MLRLARGKLFENMSFRYMGAALVRRWSGRSGQAGAIWGPMRSSYVPAEARIVRYGRFHPYSRLGSVPFTHKPLRHCPPAGAVSHVRLQAAPPGYLRSRNMGNAMGCTHPNSETHTKDLPSRALSLSL